MGGKLTTNICLVPVLKISGAKPLLPLYTFMTWKRKMCLYVLYYCTADLLPDTHLDANKYDYYTFMEDMKNVKECIKNCDLNL